MVSNAKYHGKMYFVYAHVKICSKQNFYLHLWSSWALVTPLSEEDKIYNLSTHSSQKSHDRKQVLENLPQSCRLRVHIRRIKTQQDG